MATKGLKRSKRNAVLGGVCAGIADYLGWDAGRVRLLYILVSILSVAFPGALVYLILWVAMPAE